MNPFPPYIISHHLHNEGRTAAPDPVQVALTVLRKIADHVPQHVPDDWIAMVPAKLLRDAKAAVEALS